MLVEASFTIGYHKMRTFCTLVHAARDSSQSVEAVFIRTRGRNSQHSVYHSAVARGDPSFHSTDSESTLSVTLIY